VTLSAATLITLGGVRAQVLTVPENAMLLLHLPEPTKPDTVDALRMAVLHLADQLDIDPERVVLLEPGMRIEAMDVEALHRHGLQRIADAG
jgi:hypothetical protein